jgi:hypothetical protein
VLLFLSDHVVAKEVTVMNKDKKRQEKEKKASVSDSKKKDIELTDAQLQQASGGLTRPSLKSTSTIS